MTTTTAAAPDNDDVSTRRRDDDVVGMLLCAWDGDHAERERGSRRGSHGWQVGWLAREPVWPVGWLGHPDSSLLECNFEPNLSNFSLKSKIARLLEML